MRIGRKFGKRSDPVYLTPVPRPDRALPAPPLRQWFRRRLLAWYRQNGRSLPWRETRDPYRILVSEIMLKQTQVDRVQPKYHEWIERYPRLEDLATGPMGAVSTTWYRA